MQEKMKLFLVLLLLAGSAILSFAVWEHRPAEGDLCYETKKVFLNQSVDKYLRMSFYSVELIGLPKSLLTSYDTYIFETETEPIEGMKPDEIYDITWCKVGNMSYIRRIE